MIMQTIIQTLQAKLDAGQNPDIVGDLINHARTLEDCVESVDAAITELCDEINEDMYACINAGSFWRSEFLRKFADKLSDISKLLEVEAKP